MSFVEEITRTDEGILEMRGNELVLYDINNEPDGDPVAIRFRSINETKGKHSIDKYINGAWREIGFIQYKEDERGRTDPTHQHALEVVFWTHKAGHETFEDSAQQQDYERVMTIRHDGVVFDKSTPVVQGWPSRFQSDRGRFVYNVQDDAASGPAGRIVIYDTWDSTGNRKADESQWVAVGTITPISI